MILTKHAEQRALQRSVPEAVIAALLVIGKREFDGRGGCRVYLDKRTRKKFIAAFGTATYEKYSSVYLVTRAQKALRDTVVTVAWRH